jgi:hypothetical protein
MLCRALLLCVMLCCAQIQELQQSLLLSMLPHNEEDEGNVILEIRSSVGGDWAGGFAADLLEMYRLFAAEQGWRFTVSSFSRAGSCCTTAIWQGVCGLCLLQGQLGSMWSDALLSLHLPAPFHTHRCLTARQQTWVVSSRRQP